MGLTLSVNTVLWNDPEPALSLLGLENLYVLSPGLAMHDKAPGHEADQVQECRGSMWVPQVPDPHRAGPANANHHHSELPLGLKHKGPR